MLSVPTLWIIFVVNFVAIGIVWAHVVRSYPNLDATRFWMAGALVAALGAAIAMTRGFIDPQNAELLLVPLLLGGSMLVLAICLASMGIRRFYGVPVSWRSTAVMVALNFISLAYFVWHDNMVARIVIYSVFQSLPIAMTLPLLFSRRNGNAYPGRASPAISRC
jgi:hypothetical protein